MTISRDLLSISRDLLTISRDLLSISRDLSTISRDLLTISRGDVGASVRQRLPVCLDLRLGPRAACGDALSDRNWCEHLPLLADYLRRAARARTPRFRGGGKGGLTVRQSFRIISPTGSAMPAGERRGVRRYVKGRDMRSICTRQERCASDHTCKGTDLRPNCT